MNESFKSFSLRYREGLISAISAGFFFVLVGAIFLTTPNLFDKIIDFFHDFRLVIVPGFENVRLPAPALPRTHLVVYKAVEQFSLVWGLFQIVILALRFVARSLWSKKAEAVSNIVFWFGANFLVRMLLIETTRWFVFWSGIIMLIGVSLVVRAIVLAVVPKRHLI